MNEKEGRITFLEKTSYDKDPKEFVRQFLVKKCINKNYIDDILKYGLVDSCVNALICEGLTCDEVALLQNAFKETNSDTCDCSSIETTISSKHPEADYLKENFNAILSSGLREIALKKPFDPIEYLGHWLLHYRICDEREKRKKEFEKELLEERLNWQEAHPVVCPSLKEQIIFHRSTPKKEGEEFEENYFYEENEFRELV